MCTAVAYKKKGFYFGRNLDYERGFGEAVVLMPRGYKRKMSNFENLGGEYAVLGMAKVLFEFPLFFDGMNEAGLCIAGLNFVSSAVYQKEKQGALNIAQYEFIPWLLGRCKNVSEARELILKMNMTDKAFSRELPPSTLHWLIADKDESIVLEITKDGVNLYENKTGVLTNNPPFPFQLFALNDYMNLSPKNPKNNFSSLNLWEYSRGMGALGLPGDFSSRSRFIKGAFVNFNSIPFEDDEISAVFHILSSVEQPRGCCETEDGEIEFTRYSSCLALNERVYYYKTYNNSRITGIKMNEKEMSGDRLYIYPQRKANDIFWEN